MRNGCSDRLSREGRILSFGEAMECYLGQIEEELTPLLDDPDIGAEMTLSANAMREAHRIACAIYRLAEGDEELAIRAMEDYPNELVQSIGEALEAGDYALLAI